MTGEKWWGRANVANAQFRIERLRNLAKQGFAIALVQAIFWFAMVPVLFVTGHEAHTTFPLSNYQAARLSSPDEKGLASAKFDPIEGPGWYSCCEPGYWAIRFVATIDSLPPTQVGMIVQAFADNKHVLVNGSVVYAPGRLQMPGNTYHGNLNTIVEIPSSAFHVGENQIEYLLVRDAMPYFDLSEPEIGPLDEMQRAYGRQNFLLNEFEMICVAAGALIALFAFVLFLQSEAKGFPFAVFLLSGIWTLKTHYYLWYDPPIHGEARLLYYFAVTAALPAAWLHFADEWTGHANRWVRWGAVGGGVLVIGSCIASLRVLPPGPGFDVASDVVNYGGLALMALTFVRLGWHVIRNGDSRHWEIAIFVLIATLTTLEFVREFLWQEASAYMSRTEPLLLVGFAVAFFSRSVRLFRSSDQISQALSQRLEAREAELAIAHERERDLVRERAHLDERKRILRDMHDGLGSQLMSMLLAARRGVAPPDKIAEGLQSVVDEMRLMISSMDSVGESLQSALLLFRDRTAPRVEAAGFRFEWSSNFLGLLPALGARPTLQVFRILQEAVTNALKHSGGSVIAVEMTSNPQAPSHARIIVRDDGRGESHERGGGRGISNMRMRAESLGAAVSIAFGDNGGQVVLDLPFVENTAATATLLDTHAEEVSNAEHSFQPS